MARPPRWLFVTDILVATGIQLGAVEYAIDPGKLHALMKRVNRFNSERTSEIARAVARP